MNITKSKIITCSVTIFFITMFVMLFCSCANQTRQEMQINELEQFKQTDVNLITKVDVIKFTEGGADKQSVTDKNEINKLYNKFKNIKITGESNMSCDDNTVGYTFYFSDGKTFNASFEDTTLIIGKGRYTFE